MLGSASKYRRAGRSIDPDGILSYNKARLRGCFQVFLGSSTVERPAVNR